jgi:hypothetical protein
MKFRRLQATSTATSQRLFMSCLRQIRNVVSIVLPGHPSDQTQPLDLGVFEMKKQYLQNQPEATTGNTKCSQ